MAFDLGALVTRLVVQGQQEFDSAIDRAGTGLARGAQNADRLSLALGNMGTPLDRVQRGARLIGDEFAGLSDRGQRALTVVGTGLVAAGLAVGSMVGLAVAKYSEYDAAVSRSIAVTGAYGEELEEVRHLTQELGADTIFTATEAAQGVTELGKAGITTANILGGALAGSLDLAAAGELGVADAAAITATTLNQFKLAGRDASHVADLLAAGAGKAQGDVTDMAYALRQSGLVASQFGISVEESVGSLAAFASAGLMGSDAGTSFRTMLLNLATPTLAQSNLMKEFNINAYDAQGNFVGIASLAGQLERAFKGSTQATRDQTLGIIFGSDAIRAANVLYNQGEAGIRRWTAAVDDAGYAADIAQINTDNLRGDLEKLGGAFDTALIRTGEAADGVLRDLVQRATELVDGFADLPPWMQQIVLVGAALIAGVALLGGSMLIAIPKILEFRAHLAVLRAEMPLTSAALGRLTSFLAGPWGIAILAATVGLTAYNSILEDARPSTEELTAALIANRASAESMLLTYAKGRGVLGNDLPVAVDKLQVALEKAGNTPNPFSFFFEFDSSIQNTYSAVQRMGEQLGTLVQSDLPSAQRAFRALAAETDGSRETLGYLLTATGDYRTQLIALATENGDYLETMSEQEKLTVLLRYATGENARANTNAAQAYVDAEREADQLRGTLEELLEVLEDANKTGQNAITSNIDYENALREVNEAIAEAKKGTEGYGLTLDTTTEAGARNMELLVNLSKRGWEAAEAQLALDGNTTNFAANLEATRQQVIDRAIDLGYTADQASALADQIIRIPSKKEIDIIADTLAAQVAIDNFIRTNNGRVIRFGSTISSPGNMTAQADGSVRGPAGVRYMADGGLLSSQPPQMLGPGRAIIWREDETEGESFIPHAFSKRVRSEAILAATAALFGGTYIPAGARQMANGDGPDHAPAGVGRAVNVGGIHLHGVVERDIMSATREAVDYVKAELSV